MMPLAFDLISILVIGSILPVATTERSIVPSSTVASFDGSMLADAPLMVEKPQMPATRRTTPAAAIRLSFLDFLMRPSCRPAPGDRTRMLTDRRVGKLPRRGLYVDS